MSQELDRDNIIRLLNQLGSDNDEEIMTSARALHAQVSDANVDWNDLLVGQTEADPIAEEDEIEEEDTSEESNNGEELSDSEANKIIDKILSNSDISEYLKEELEDYKTDIKEGEFEASDRSYLIALNKRL
ncbi:MAG: hypothetical protein HN578_15390 [Rhodospirillales bacterium]|jgi:hypothetical protein|nr:hypothetical protein [Rhodospirillales bacterium]MBT3904563.1 hypothetical protein [Rhodospirillaceae bacterium]MBT5033979.1 hypothetical protein [Rhodospirillaceae bacterium]MBT6218203.1 hypothetical protein [Rhodospirillaceae bacterium]MBT6363869.1 hypothetical protein [Rhodospirillaceae bacterium]